MKKLLERGGWTIFFVKGTRLVFRRDNKMKIFYLLKQYGCPPVALLGEEKKSLVQRGRPSSPWCREGGRWSNFFLLYFVWPVSPHWAS